jgi:hypothetical protein
VNGYLRYPASTSRSLPHIRYEKVHEKVRACFLRSALLCSEPHHADGAEMRNASLAKRALTRSPAAAPVLTAKSVPIPSK